MTPERTKELMPVMQAHAEGKPIRSRIRGTDTWVRCIDPTWDDGFDYEVEPEPREWWLRMEGERAVVFYSAEAASEFARITGCEALHVREVLP